MVVSLPLLMQEGGGNQEKGAMFPAPSPGEGSTLFCVPVSAPGYGKYMAYTVPLNTCISPTGSV